MQKLSRRETEVAVLLLKGALNREIAALFDIQLGTVKIHVREIRAKLQINRRTSSKIGISEFVSKLLMGITIPDSLSESPGVKAAEAVEPKAAEIYDEARGC